MLIICVKKSLNLCLAGKTVMYGSPLSPSELSFLHYSDNSGGTQTIFFLNDVLWQHAHVLPRFTPPRESSPTATSNPVMSCDDKVWKGLNSRKSQPLDK